MEMHQIIYFLKAAQTQNMTRAAQELHVSQPSLSRQIKLLEEELGALLFERLSQGLRLTPAGQALLPYLSNVMQQLERATEMLQPFTSGQKGRVVIGTTPSLATSFLPTVLAAYLRRFPEAETAVHVRPTSGEVLRRLHDGDIDVAVCGGQVPDLERVFLFDQTLVAAVPDTLGHEVGEVVTLDDLERLPIVVTPSTCTVRQLLPERLTQVAEVDQLDATLQFATRGIGIAIVLESMAQARAGVRFLPLRPELRHRVYAQWRPAGFLWAEHPLVVAMCRPI